MTKLPVLQLAFCCLVSLALFSCKKQTISPAGVEEFPSKLNGQQNMDRYYGPSVAMGNGSARSWISVNPGGRPMELGIEMTHEALQGLPTGEMDHPEFVLPLPSQALELTPFKHLVINWNPHGHPLQGIYTVPHFDFHFYTITNAARQAIGIDPAVFIVPPDGYLPEGYVKGDPVPQMGMHWVDPTSPEFHGQPFTYTMIYGSYNGAVIFTEPMITMQVLQSGMAYNKLTIPQPTYYSPSNTYYPKHYNIYMDPATQKHYVTYSEFQKR